MLNTSHAPPLAVLWDFGGVILTSPFEAFRLYELEAGLPEDFIRMLNARNPDTNAWAKMERSEVSLAEFVALFEAEAGALGHKIDGWRVLKAISGDIRPQMVEALRRCKAAFKVACITNNMKAGEGPGMERDYDHASARHACDLKGPEDIGRSAGEKAVKRLNPRSMSSQSVPVVFHPDEASGLLVETSASKLFALTEASRRAMSYSSPRMPGASIRNSTGG